MPDQTGAMPATQDATSGTNNQPATEGSTTSTSQSTAGATPTDEGLGDAGKATLEKLRAELRQATKDRDAAQADLKKRADAELSETERLKKTTADLEAKLADREKAVQERTARSAIVASAAKAGFADPEDAVMFLRDQVEFDDDGEPKGIDALVAGLAKRKPNLLGSHVRPTGSIDGGARGGSALTREAIDRMTTAEYAKNRPEIMAWMAQQTKK